MDFLTKIDRTVSAGKLPEKLGQYIHNFYLSYDLALKANGKDIKDYLPILNKFLELVVKQVEKPYVFDPFHKSIRKPFDYYQFGKDFIRPLILSNKSTVQHIENVNKMQAQLAKGDNVILLANHQTEPDPQIISLLLEKTHPDIGENMIFVAGHRVVCDPLAVPFSKGCNLLCIYSKKHIENPPELKQVKLLHNQKTMKMMSQLLHQGGKCIYVAPSGGRDRPNGEGKLDVAPFDPQSIEMFLLIAKQASTPTHFYPLALSTYHLLPPPNSVEKELGERRHAQCTPVHLAFGNEIDMENFPGRDLADKKQRRIARANYIWNLVKEDYKQIAG